MTPDEVREARKALGMTQAELAMRLGLQGPYAKDTVRGWESGKRPCSGPAALAIQYLIRDLKEGAA